MLLEASTTIERVANQQVMHDPFYIPTVDRIAAILGRLKTSDHEAADAGVTNG